MRIWKVFSAYNLYLRLVAIYKDIYEIGLQPTLKNIYYRSENRMEIFILCCFGGVFFCLVQLHEPLIKLTFCFSQLSSNWDFFQPNNFITHLTVL